MYVNSKHQRTRTPNPIAAPPRSGGYSLLEAVVTISVIGILTGLILSGLVTARRNAAVRRAADQFAGHLREAESLAQSGVKDPACLAAAGADPERRRECSKYRVSFTGGTTTYTRDTILDGTSYGALTFALPAGAIFAGSGETTMTFTYTPPVMTILDAANVAITHAAATGAQAFVCVSPRGVIDVVPNGC